MGSRYEILDIHYPCLCPCIGRLAAVLVLALLGAFVHISFTAMKVRDVFVSHIYNSILLIDSMPICRTLLFLLLCSMIVLCMQAQQLRQYIAYNK